MMSLATRLVLAIVLAAAALGAAPVRAQFISHIDLAPIPRLDEDECPKTGAEPLAAGAPHTIEGLIGGATLNTVQALTNLTALLEASVTSRAIDALNADVSLRDPQVAAANAVGAMAKGLPMGALALLLKAREGAPDDPLHLANLSGLSNYFGMHREALAMVAEAGRKKLADTRIGGMSLRAVLLSNQGHALNATGRPKEGEAALREAIKLEPNLAEAYVNMAFSLGDQDKCPLAARYLRAGKTRKPAKVLADTDRPRADDDPPEQVPVAEVIDLSRGRAGLLPGMTIAGSPEDADNDALKARLQGLINNRETAAAHTRKLKAGMQAQQQRSAWAQRDPIGVLSADRAEWLTQLSTWYAEDSVILLQLAGTPEQFGKRYDRVKGAAQFEGVPRHADPDLQKLVHASLRNALDMVAQREAASDGYRERSAIIQRTFNKEDNECVRRNDNLCGASARLRRDTALCAAAKEAAGQRMGSMTAHSAAFRDLYGESHRRLTAVASYFSDPTHHREANERIKWFAHMSTNLLAGMVEAHRAEQAVGADACRASNKRQVDLVIEHLVALEAARCDPGGKSGSWGVGAVEMGANCEEVSVTAATPGPVGLFAKVGYELSKRYEYVKHGKERFLAQQAGLDPRVRLHVPDYGAAFDGKLTVYAGVHAGAGSVSGKAGGYVEFNGQGDVSGYGRQSEVTKTSGPPLIGGAKAGLESTIYTSRTPLFSASHGTD